MPDDATVPDAPEAALPPTCLVPGWKVFGPGYHKGELYTLADCKRMGDYFARLSADPDDDKRYLTPRVKLGHDDQQRYAASLGLPNLGKISGCRVDQDGTVEIDLTDVPTQLGAAINAKIFRDGSIEIPKPLPDPDDAGRPKLHPVLSAVSLLGEEQPAVKGMPPPEAVFPDGTPVPAATDLTPWLTAMAEVAKTFSAESRVTFRGSEYQTSAVCFSAMTPQRDQAMRDELNAKLAAMYGPDAPAQYAAYSDDQVKQIVGDGEKYSAQMKAKLAEDADAAKKKADDEAAAKLAADEAAKKKDDEDKAKGDFAAQFATFTSNFNTFATECRDRFAAGDKRFGDMETAVKDLKPKADMAAAMSDRFDADQKAAHKTAVETVVDQAIKDGRLTRRDRELHIGHGMSQSDKQTFSDGAHKGKTAFQVWKDELAARPKTKFFDEQIADGKATGKSSTAVSPLVRRMLESESVHRYAPAARAAMLKAAGETP